MQRRMLAILFQSKRAIRDDECLEMNKLAPKDTRVLLVADMKHLKETHAGRWPSFYQRLCR